MADFDLVVIGGGPAGYVGAIRAAQMGKKVACIERDALGGTCLNWGCIPTKSLLAGAELYHKMKHEAADWGIQAGELSHDFSKVIARSRSVAGNLANGVAFLFRKNKITHVQGDAYIRNPGMPNADAASREFTIEVYAADDQAHEGEVSQTITASNILVATGAKARELPGTPFDGDKVLNAKDAMCLSEQPKKLLIIGSGAIGMEFACFYHEFGTEVTVVEMQERILPIEDDDISKEVQKSFTKRGVKILTGHVTKELTVSDNGVKAVVGKVGEDEDGETIEADKVLVAIGVTGRFEGLFEPTLGIETERGHIKTHYKAAGATYETSVPGIYAVGDVIGPPWLAHVASEEAIIAVERLFGHEAPDVDYDSVPGCTYCFPQIASIGLTERACKEQGLDYSVGKFPFQALGKAQATGHTEGFAKLITDKATGEILGAHLLGENVTELISELCLARRVEATADELISTMHAHPTLSEAVHESALGTQGRMIHF